MEENYEERINVETTPLLSHDHTSNQTQSQQYDDLKSELYRLRRIRLAQVSFILPVINFIFQCIILSFYSLQITTDRFGVNHHFLFMCLKSLICIIGTVMLCKCTPYRDARQALVRNETISTIRRHDATSPTETVSPFFKFTTLTMRIAYCLGGTAFIQLFVCRNQQTDTQLLSFSDSDDPFAHLQDRLKNDGFDYTEITINVWLALEGGLYIISGLLLHYYLLRNKKYEESLIRNKNIAPFGIGHVVNGVKCLVVACYVAMIESFLRLCYEHDAESFRTGLIRQQFFFILQLLSYCCLL